MHHFNSESKRLWERVRNSYHCFFGLKIEGTHFKKILLSPNENLSPQAIQGMWQAYGQMRAGRTTMLGTIIASGFVAAGLAYYQRSLSEQAEKLKLIQDEIDKNRLELEERKKEVSKREETANKVYSFFKEVYATNRVTQKRFELANSKISGLLTEEEARMDYTNQLKNLETSEYREGLKEFDNLKMIPTKK